jgi:class 3 adenylate cyclase/serine/threonine protein kinase
MDESIQLKEDYRQSIEEFRSRHKTGVLVLVFTDIVGSTALKQKLGDFTGNALISRHNEVVRELLKDFPESAEISTAGDSFFLVFIRPSDAVRFSLLLHTRLRELSQTTPQPIFIRIGIHMGEVQIMRDPHSEDGVQDILGLNVDIAARIMSLARPEQTLMSRGVFDNARSTLKGDAEMPSVSWINHGPYALKGIEEPQEIAEAGEEGFAPLSAPPDSEKARSVSPIDASLVVGWRPSLGAEIPTAPGWQIFEKLGEGGFGEVWRAVKTQAAEGENPTRLGTLQSLPLGATVAFKFCFDLAHARALRREATLFSLLQKKQDKLRHTVKMVDYQFDQAPLFIVLEYIPGKNLGQWIQEDGAAVKPLRRLQMMASVAHAIHGVHEAGIIINDIKPSNVLVRVKEGGESEFLISDLGIGLVRDKQYLQDVEMTRTTGFTQTFHSTSSGGMGPGGSLPYLAPELLSGGVPSLASDVYAFGVTLIQVAAGNPRLAFSESWRKQVPGSSARKLIKPLVGGEAEKRPTDMGRIARRLERLPRTVFLKRLWISAAASLPILLASFLVYREFLLTPRMRDLAQKEEARVAAMGYATGYESFNRKYPVTPEGKRAVFRVAALAKELLLSRDSIKKGDRYPVSPLSWTQLCNDKITSSTDRLKLLSEAMSGIGDSLQSDETLNSYVKESQNLLDELIALSKSVPYRELSFRLYPDSGPAFASTPQLRTSGSADPKDEGIDVSVVNELPQCYQALLPLALYEAISRGDTHRAYEILTAFLFLSRSLQAGGNNTMVYYTGVSLHNTCQCYALALIKTFPPGKEEALRLYDILDPQQDLRMFERVMEGMFLNAQDILRGQIEGDWLAKVMSFVPVTSSFRENCIGWLFSRYPNWFKPELYHTSSVQYEILGQLKNVMEVRNTEQERILDDESYRADIGEIEIPTMGMVLSAGRMTRSTCAFASLVRSVLLLRVMEIESGALPSRMPQSLSPLFEKQGDRPPLDYCGETPGSQVEYLPDPQNGAYVLRIQGDGLPVPPKDASEVAFSYLGQWGIGNSNETTSTAPPARGGEFTNSIGLLLGR